MWFDDEETSGKRLLSRKRNARRAPILKVNTRLRVQKKTKMYRIAVFVLVPAVIAAASVLLWFGVCMAGRLLFSSNDRFRIVNLEIKEGEVITGDLIREYTRISEGMNLFEFDIGNIRDAFLRRSPNVKSMEISRYLPDTLKIEVVERTPLARIGWRGHLVTDREGFVFGFRSGLRGLPVITGYRARNLRPGRRVGGMALAALEVLDACDNPTLGINVESVETGNADYLVLRLSDRKSVKLSWDKMGRMTRESRRLLRGKLGRLARTLQSEHGRRLTKIDATLDNRIYAR